MIVPFATILLLVGCDSPTVPRLPPPVEEEEDTGDIEEGMRSVRNAVPGSLSSDLAKRSDMPFTSSIRETTT